MMKKLKIVIVIFFFFGLLSAQNSDESAVYLNNGSVFVGKIVSYEQGGNLKMIVNDSISLEFADKDIEKIVQAGAAEKFKESITMKSTGWFNETQAGFSFGTSFQDEMVTGMVFSNTTGYQFNHFYGIGFGAGISGFELSSKKVRMLPVFSEFRTISNNKKQNMVFALKLGYGFVWKDSKFDMNKGGLFFSPEIRYRFTGNKSNKSDWAISLAYISQNIYYEEDKTYNDWWWGMNGIKKRYDITMRRIKVGVVVNFWR